MNADLVRTIEHISDSRYCFAIAPKTVVLRLRVAKGAALEKVSVMYGSKYDFYKNRSESEMTIGFTDMLFDYYITTIELTDPRLVYIFSLYKDGILKYYSEEGLCGDYDFVTNYITAFQLACINATDIKETVAWFKSAIFYQIFVERFKDGGGDKNYVNLKWGDKPTPKSFAGGDLRGIIQSLDYIVNLGANALYLTPIFSSPTNHKYEITDYYAIDPMFGTAADFLELVNKAHKRGLKVVLDAVFNHCSKDFLPFMDVCEKGRQSIYYNWFIIHGDKPDIKKKNYDFFGLDNPEMPKLNLCDPICRKYFLDVAAYWIKEYDIDGWRLDVSDEVPHDFWRDFRRVVKQIKRDAVILGENWHNAETYLRGDQFDGIMNYAFTKACWDFFAGKTISTKQFAERLNGLIVRNTDAANAMMLNLLDSHDTFRFITLLKNDADALCSALALTFLFPGAPSVYYGTEINLEGGFDPDSRRCMDWEAQNKHNKTKEAIQKLSKLRGLDAIRHGMAKITNNEDTLVLERFYNDNRVTLYVKRNEYRIEVNGLCQNA